MSRLLQASTLNLLSVLKNYEDVGNASTKLFGLEITPKNLSQTDCYLKTSVLEKEQRA